MARTQSRHLEREVRHSGIQCSLGFATLDKAAALALATATPLTDLRQDLNSNLGFGDLKIGILFS